MQQENASEYKEMKENEKYIGGGWTMEVKVIDATVKQAWIRLFKDSIQKDDKIVFLNEVYI